MIEERARVVAVEDSRVWLEARRRSTCGACALRNGCGHGLLDALGRGRSVHLSVPRPVAPAALEVGESVVLGLPEQAVLGASLRVYLLPLLGLLGGGAMGAAAGGDPAAATAGLAGLLLGIALARRWQRSGGEVEPVILRRGPAGGADPAEPCPVSVV